MAAAAVLDYELLWEKRLAENKKRLLDLNLPQLVQTVKSQSPKLSPGLPRQFCASFLPKRVDTITLIDEDGDEFPTLYLAQKNGLSSGWRGFSIAHNSVDGRCSGFSADKAHNLQGSHHRGNEKLD